MIPPARALITGGAGTLGRALATVLLARGFAIVLTDRDDARLEMARRELGNPAGLSVRRLDVTDADAWSTLADEIETVDGPVTVLVNNACLPSARRPLIGITPAEWTALVAVALTGPFLGARAFGARMAARGSGHILNMASLAGLRGMADHGDYAAAKAGLISLSETLRDELGPAGVCVSVACPGAIGHPLGHMGSPGAGTAAPGRMDPVSGMAGVVDAMLAGQFYIMTHRTTRTLIERRGSELLAACDRAMRDSHES